MTIHKNPLVKPFVKWAGGKRQLLPEIKRYLPSKIKDYYEPFVGGGAVFWDIQCPHPVINDFNDELINTYLVVRDDVDSLIHLLKKHELNNSSDYYYQMRAWDRTGELQKRSNTERAARFIYLNKTGFNGLFRVNSQGQINVPYGRYKNPAIVNEEVLHAVSLYLNRSSATIFNGDYYDAIKSAKKGDFVYLDPPYAPISEDKQSFVGYTFVPFINQGIMPIRVGSDQISLLRGYSTIAINIIASICLFFLTIKVYQKNALNYNTGFNIKRIFKSKKR